MQIKYIWSERRTELLLNSEPQCSGAHLASYPMDKEGYILGGKPAGT
jgi:hypothetical protein